MNRSVNFIFFFFLNSISLVRVDRLKDARKEAEKEISALKQQKLAEYGKFEKEFAGSSDASTNLVNAETETKLTQTQTSFELHQDEVVNILLNTVVTCEPKLHPNVKLQ
ncbi:H(+)-transporting V1 sector ATPase subunit G [Coelomomyces lativittatus]|nr:H(+)-transporting V1 sector ATPase subunit G [Coelomomyces lativittatus]KAJ1504426.1 H(+)-transporting V1 sector ATPase subunit G [Coelomomyces lativittatus]